MNPNAVAYVAGSERTEHSFGGMLNINENPVHKAYVTTRSNATSVNANQPKFNGIRDSAVVAMPGGKLDAVNSTYTTQVQRITTIYKERRLPHGHHND
jgi:hypothetical protein